jgi:hypothetical protein
MRQLLHYFLVSFVMLSGSAIFQLIEQLGSRLDKALGNNSILSGWRHR